MNYVNTLFAFVCSQFVSLLLMYLIEFTYRLLQHVKNITENINLRVSIIKNWHLHSISSVCNKHKKNEKIHLVYYVSVRLISEIINMMPYFYVESANHPHLFSK